MTRKTSTCVRYRIWPGQGSSAVFASASARYVTPGTSRTTASRPCRTVFVASIATTRNGIHAPSELQNHRQAGPSTVMGDHAPAAGGPAVVENSRQVSNQRRT